MNNYTPPPPKQQDPPSLLIPPELSASFHYFGVCPSAQTYLTHAIELNLHMLYAVPCKRWSCRVCAEKKIKKLSMQVEKARPNRLLTLTVNPPLFSSPRNAFDGTRKQVPLLIRKLRTKYGEVEYLRVTEATQRGWPHYHLLIRSDYIPQPVVKDLWNSMTGARIVDLRQVKKSFSAYRYLVKYLSKLHNLEWTERHVSLSRNFAPPDQFEPQDPEQTAQGELFFQHPATYICEHCQGWKIVRYGHSAHLLLPPRSVEADLPS